MYVLPRLVRNAAIALLAALPLASSAQLHVSARPEVRVVAQVDSKVKTTLTGNVPTSVAQGVIAGRLSSETQLQHVMLMLKPSDTQIAALHTLLDAQQDKNSPSFHKWLTPETYAQSFGVAPADIAKVTAWLQDSGFTVEQVSKSTRIVQFSGTVGQVESAFSTELHNVTVNGAAHISNTTEISVPAALAPVIQGVVRLNNFFPEGNNNKATTVAAQAGVGQSAGGPVAPQYTSASGTHYVTPGDVATIFNSAPLTTAATPITGKGVSIAVLGRSNITPGDVATFRSMFGLPAKNPKITVIGADPGLNADDTEAYLDAEWAGAVAADADVNFIVSSASLVQGGIDAAGLYAVDNNIGDIISLSYGGCERNNGASGTAFYNTLWEQAAAQGQTAFVSSGDSNAAGCDSSGATYATGGYGVNALGSSNYNVAVGGSIFNDVRDPASTTSPYWGATGGTVIPFANALSYIPEAVLNQGRLGTYLNAAQTAFVAGSGIFGTGGGISIYTARPSWQTGSGISATADPTDYNNAVVPLTGTPITGAHRLVPDVSLISANGHDGTLFCAGSICQTNPTTGGLVNAGIVGGTSVATPVMASVQALINQKNGGRQGNANIYYYKLADTQYTASATACQSVNGTVANPVVTLPAATCNFHDIVTGNNVAPTAATGTAGIGFNAAVGYDVASGLGSVNIANVANNWSSVVFNATATTFTLNPTTITHGTNQAFTVQVTPASGTGTPTGDVAIIASTETAFGTPQVFTLAAGSAAGNINSLPGGTYTVYAHYAGDSTFASSNSAPVTVTIAKEGSVITQAAYLITAAGNLTQPASFAYGTSEIYLDTDVTGVSSNGQYNSSGLPTTGTPSGAVNYTVTRNGSALAPLTTSLDTYGTTYLISGLGYTNFYLLPNYAVLVPGNYTVTANYAGDTSFNASTASTSFTVTQATPVSTLTTSTAQINVGGTATLNFTVPSASTVAAAATGTVTFRDTTTNSTLGTATVTNGAAVFNTNLIALLGANTITATYSGDVNYAPGNVPSVVVTVGANTAPTLSVSTTGTLRVGTAIGLTGTLSAATNAASTVSFYDNNTVLLGTVTIASGATTTSLTVNTFTAGAHNITAIYAGTPAATMPQASATSPVQPINIAQNTTLTNFGAPTTGQYGSVLLSVNIRRGTNLPTNGAPYVPLTGTVTFYDGAVTPANAIATGTPVFDPSGYNTYSASGTASSLAPGNHTLTAVYSGDANYAGSTSGTTPTITVAKGDPTAAVNPSSIVYGTATSTITGSLAFGGTTAPTGAVTLTVSGGATVTATCTGTTSPLTCTAANYNTATLVAGPHTTTLSYAGDTNYNAATATNAFTVTKATATVTLGSLSATYDGNPHGATATTTPAGLTVTLTYNGSATVPMNAGSYAVVATVNDANYTGSATGTLVIAAAVTPITFNVLNHTFGDPPFTVTATSASAGAFTYTVVSGPATINGNTVTLTGPGTVVLQASQAASGNYAANTQQASFNVAPGTAAPITFSVPNHTYGDAPFTVTATSASPGAFTYTVVSGPATISGNTVTLTGVGTVVLQAAQAASGTYSAGSQQTTFNVAAAVAPITFNMPNHTYGDAPFTVTATSASSGAFTYTVVSGPATISGNTVTLTGTGTVVLQAAQAAAGNYTANTQQATFTVAAGTTPITFTVPNHTYGDASFTVTATSASPGAFTYSVVSGPATISGNTVTLTGAGAVTLQASQAASGTYAANSQQTTFTVATAATTTTVTSSLNPSTAGAAVTFTATVKTTAGLAATGSVIFSDGATVLGTATLTNGVATYTTSTLTMAAHTVTAAFQGSANFAASSGTVVQTVNAAPIAATTTVVTSSANPSLFSAPVNFAATVLSNGNTIPAGTVIFSEGTTQLASVPLVNGTATYTTSTLSVGSHVITASFQGSAAYAASTGTITQVVNPATFTLTDNGASSFALTVVRGSTGSTIISVNPTASFAGTVTLSCTGLPANATCYFFNPTLTFTGTGGAQTSALRIDTYTLTSAARAAQLVRNDSPFGARLTFAFALPGLLLAGFGARSRKLRKNPLMMVAFLLIGLAGAATLTGCGTSNQNSLTAAAGTYTVNVVATSGTQTQTLPITLTIQ